MQSIEEGQDRLSKAGRNLDESEEMRILGIDKDYHTQKDVREEAEEAADDSSEIGE